MKIITNQTRKMKYKNILILIFVFSSQQLLATTVINNPVMFVTQFPISQDFATIGSTFANHLGKITSVGRGGDLYIRYADGSLRNLTKEAGFGHDGLQDESAIAVRDPTIHWSGTKALFSMVIGAPNIFQQNDYYWQIYEISGFEQGQTITINKIPNQPVNYNNITPLYDSDDNIVFTSDMPRSKNRYNYPQKDEYESTATTTGLWKLSRQTGEIDLLQHSPSGSFSPFIDSFGRLVFTRWDHLQRDQQASPTNNNGAFNYSSELPTAQAINTVLEIFPEPRSAETALLEGTNLEGHSINHFFPWQLNQDGSGEETINHIGRHELHNYFNRSINDDSNIIEFIANSSRPNQNVIRNAFHLSEDPSNSGRYIGIDAPEFSTHNGGQIIAFKLAPNDKPNLMSVEYLTHPETRNTIDDGTNASDNNIGFSRDPIILDNGTLIASHTTEVRRARNDGTRANPIPRFDFRLKTYSLHSTGYYRPANNLTTLGDVNISYYDPDILVTYNGPLWELQAVEVIAREVPPHTFSQIQAPEINVLNEENIDVNNFELFLKNNNLAVVVMRDVTTRDVADKQQPYNLKVSNSTHQTIGTTGKIYELSHMQFFQADQIRGSGGVISPDAGQRVIAQYLHDENAIQNNINYVGAPQGSTQIFADGSVALFVPTGRAISWQSLDPNATPVVRERYWINFKAGEIRACGGCHGVNDLDQAGNPPNTQNTQAFHALLQHWKNHQNDLIFNNGFE